MFSENHHASTNTLDQVQRIRKRISSPHKAEASIVYSDDDIVAFMDLQPVTPGHLLVVPRRHAVGLSDLDENLVFPRFPGDNFRIDADWRPRDRVELDQTAAAVRNGWERLIDPSARTLS